MSESEIRNCLWMTVGTCIFYLNNNNYFLIVDYYFRYFPIVKLEYILASSVITHIKSYLARHSIPSIFSVIYIKHFVIVFIDFF